jgi:hypothetical protein
VDAGAVEEGFVTHRRQPDNRWGCHTISGE